MLLRLLALVAPFAAFSAFFFGLGVAQWTGISRRWYLAPTETERTVLMIFGPSPLKWIFVSLAVLFWILAELALLADWPLIVFGIPLLCSVFAAGLSVVFVVWRPTWAIPPWTKQLKGF